MMILGILDEHEVHGYELKKRMAELAGGSGASFGSLYPALNRLERAGFVHAIDNKPRLTSPFSGAITGELAAMRHQRKSEVASGKRESKRNRKVYGITDRGRARLRELLLTTDPGDDRAFSLQVAFCRHVEDADRLELFARRRTHLTTELARRASQPVPTDSYLRSLHEHDTHTLNRDLAWVDELSALTRDELTPAAVPATGGTAQP